MIAMQSARHYPCKTRDGDGPRSAFQKNVRARITGCSAGQHIIDQYDILAR